MNGWTAALVPLILSSGARPLILEPVILLSDSFVEHLSAHHALVYSRLRGGS